MNTTSDTRERLIRILEQFFRDRTLDAANARQLDRMFESLCKKGYVDVNLNCAMVRLGQDLKRYTTMTDDQKSFVDAVMRTGLYLLRMQHGRPSSDAEYAGVKNAFESETLKHPGWIDNKNLELIKSQFDMVTATRRGMSATPPNANAGAPVPGPAAAAPVQPVPPVQPVQFTSTSTSTSASLPFVDQTNAARTIDNFMEFVLAIQQKTNAAVVRAKNALEAYEATMSRAGIALYENSLTTFIVKMMITMMDKFAYSKDMYFSIGLDVAWLKVLRAVFRWNNQLMLQDVNHIATFKLYVNQLAGIEKQYQNQQDSVSAEKVRETRTYIQNKIVNNADLFTNNMASIFENDVDNLEMQMINEEKEGKLFKQMRTQRRRMRRLPNAPLLYKQKKSFVYIEPKLMTFKVKNKRLYAYTDGSSTLEPVSDETLKKIYFLLPKKIRNRLKWDDKTADAGTNPFRSEDIGRRIQVPTCTVVQDSKTTRENDIDNDDDDDDDSEGPSDALIANDDADSDASVDNFDDLFAELDRTIKRNNKKKKKSRPRMRSRKNKKKKKKKNAMFDNASEDDSDMDFL